MLLRRRGWRAFFKGFVADVGAGVHQCVDAPFVFEAEYLVADVVLGVGFFKVLALLIGFGEDYAHFGIPQDWGDLCG